MPVRLVPDVPHELVGRRLEGPVQRDGQLDHAEAGPEVPAVDRHDIDDVTSELVAELRQLLDAERADIGRRLDASEERSGRERGCAHKREAVRQQSTGDGGRLPGVRGGFGKSRDGGWGMGDGGWGMGFERPFAICSAEALPE